MSSDKIPVIDLFAGAGGFGVAVEKAHGDLRLSVELDSVCVQTLKANSPGSSHRVEEADVRALSGQDLRRLASLSNGDPLVVVGGPPCQPFSKASYWTDPGHDSRYRRARAKGIQAERPSPITQAKPDERRDLLGEFHRLVVESRAPAFVMENVVSLLHPRNRSVFQGAVLAFEGEGYQVEVVKANAASYGVPQKRKRVFVLGSRERKPEVPEKTNRAEKDDPGHLPEPEPVGPFLEPFASKEYREPEEVVKGRWEEALREIPPGSNYKHLTAWAGHPDPLFEAETRFWNFLLKLSPDLPSWTINANPGPWVGPFHWTSRRLRTAELAAIQTFPVGYRFLGSRRERVRQIGNAVPPTLAEKMVRSVLETLNGGS